MPTDNAVEWKSRNSVVFTVFKNCHKLSVSFLLETRGGTLSYTQGQNIHPLHQRKLANSKMCSESFANISHKEMRNIGITIRMSHSRQYMSALDEN